MGHPCFGRKTLQVLALVWTALKQGPAGRPAAKKVVIVAPSSLCKNWAAEAKKWLRDERLKVCVGPAWCCCCFQSLRGAQVFEKAVQCAPCMQVLVIAAGAEAQQQVQVELWLSCIYHETPEVLEGMELTMLAMDHPVGLQVWRSI
jgi:SNF2-related domain